MFEYVTFLKRVTAIDIFQKMFHVLHTERCFYEKQYLILILSF